MIVPGDIAKKLQQGNETFIVGYNNNPNQQIKNDYVKPVQKPELDQEKAEMKISPSRQPPRSNLSIPSDG